jgi:hypothetical protein
MVRLRRWLDFNRPVLVFCAAMVAAIGTDLTAGHPSALCYATEISLALALLIVFVWRLGHLGDDDQDGVEQHREYHEPSSNAHVVRRDEQDS